MAPTYGEMSEFLNAPPETDVSLTEQAVFALTEEVVQEIDEMFLQNVGDDLLKKQKRGTFLTTNEIKNPKEHVDETLRNLQEKREEFHKHDYKRDPLPFAYYAISNPEKEEDPVCIAIKIAPWNVDPVFTEVYDKLLSDVDKLLYLRKPEQWILENGQFQLCREVGNGERVWEVWRHVGDEETYSVVEKDPSLIIALRIPEDRSLFARTYKDVVLEKKRENIRLKKLSQRIKRARGH